MHLQQLLSISIKVIWLHSCSWTLNCFPFILYLYTLANNNQFFFLLITFVVIFAGKFRQYDYGILGNLNKYHEFTPPSYNLKKVTAPVALYYASNDWLSSATVSLHVRILFFIFILGLFFIKTFAGRFKTSRNLTQCS